MQHEFQSASLLLQLPDPCLLEVLRCCADDPRSLFSAARAHSRLRQAAVLAANSIRPVLKQQQQQADSLLLYLTNHGQHIDSITLFNRDFADGVCLRELPHHKLQKLADLRFVQLPLQLQPGDGYQGVISAALPIKKLCIYINKLLDGDEGLATALTQLPKLQHLTLEHGYPSVPKQWFLRGHALQALQQLTYLQLAGMGLKDPDGLRPLQRMTRLQELRLVSLEFGNSSGLQPLEGLTSLQKLQLVSLGLGDRNGLQPLEGLTRLQELLLDSLVWRDPDFLQPLQGLTRLKDLRLVSLGARTIEASMLSGLNQLTLLKVIIEEGARRMKCTVQPDILADKTQLQHLELIECNICGDTNGVTRLLLYLQPMQQLTRLNLSGSLQPEDYTIYPRLEPITPPATAYSALTSSSKLQHLDISYCEVPEGVWQHVFPAGRQLPALQVLDLVWLMHPSTHAAAPECSRLVSCCPGLQSLNMKGLQYATEVLAPLSGLTDLQELCLNHASRVSEPPTPNMFEVVYQLTGLRRLDLRNDDGNERLLLRLTQLKQLTELEYCGVNPGVHIFYARAPEDEPVWRQVLRRLCNSCDPSMALQAAAALAE